MQGVEEKQSALTAGHKIGEPARPCSPPTITGWRCVQVFSILKNRAVFRYTAQISRLLSLLSAYFYVCAFLPSQNDILPV
jgi:hypothetical protein